MILYKSILFLFLPIIWLFVSAYEQTHQMIMYRPAVVYNDKMYIRYMNISARRYGRSSPIYYTNIYFESVREMGNDITVNIYFYELLSNRYRRGFIEMHWKLCDFIAKDTILGSAVRGKVNKTCPYPPAEYRLFNLTIPQSQVPKNFPFNNGRVYANLTDTNTNKLHVSITVDMKIIDRIIRP